jgi:hypothetical protein
VKNEYQAVSQGDYWLEARRQERQEAKKKTEKVLLQASQPSIFGLKAYLQKPHNAGSRRQTPYFNTLIEVVSKPLIKPEDRFWLRAHLKRRIKR